MFNGVLSALEDENIIAWIINNQIKVESGKPVDFERFSFMIDPYMDWTPLQAANKCSQVGWSVMTNIKLDWAAVYGIPGYPIENANVIYTLPTDKDVSDFVPSKTDLIIENNPVISKQLEQTGGSKVASVTRKRLGKSMIYFKGTRSKTGALMITSDLNIHDESDRSEPDVIDQYESRLGTSPYKGVWKFSNPGAPNMPSDAAFKMSDQKHWFIKCQHCGHWQYLDWIKLSENDFRKENHCFVDDTNWQYICSGCSHPISDENRRRGLWVKKYQNMDISGYWVSHFMCSWITAKQCGMAQQTKSKAYFENFVAGRPYAGSDVVVDESVIVNNIVLGEHTWERGKVAMGIDSGDEKHYVIGDANGVFEIGVTRDWAKIELLLKKYQPYFVVDLNPYPKQAKELVFKYPKGWCSFYVDDRRTLELMEWGKKDNTRMVYPNRERLLDELINYMILGGIKFFHAKAYWIDYIDHWSTLYHADMVGDKIVAADSDGAFANEKGLKLARKVWLSSNGNDHYCHATLYYYAALSRMIAGGGKIVKSDMNPMSIMADRYKVQVARPVHDGKQSVGNIIQKTLKASMTNKKASKNPTTSGKM